METSVINTTKIDSNTGQIPGLPANPRKWTKDEMNKLKKSIAETPELLEARGAIVYPHEGRYIVLGGNMRLEAVKALKWKEMPCVILPKSLPVEKLKEIVIKDNSSFGEWDMEALSDEWDDLPLSDWGTDISWDEGERSDAMGAVKSSQEEEPDEDDRTAFYESMLKDCIYESNNEFEIPNLPLDGQAGKLELPFSAWGADSRLRKGVATYHFYVDDYRFEAIWKDPSKVLQSGVKSLVEPNISLFDTTPVSYGLFQIYRKRWISRYFMDCGVKIYVDLNVASKFYQYNLLGVPPKWDAFATRGYNDRIEYLKRELSIAQEISEKEVPNLIVYGGGGNVRDFCIEHSLVYVEQFMQNKKKEV